MTSKKEALKTITSIKTIMGKKVGNIPKKEWDALDGLFDYVFDSNPDITLGKVIDLLRITATIEIRNEENMMICICRSDSQGIDPYRNMNVIEWFVNSVKFIRTEHDPQLTFLIHTETEVETNE